MHNVLIILLLAYSWSAVNLKRNEKFEFAHNLKFCVGAAALALWAKNHIQLHKMGSNVGLDFDLELEAGGSESLLEVIPI